MLIKGIKIFEKKIIKGKKGDILKYVSSKDKFLKHFGEIYFSYLKKNQTKGWNLHKKNNCFIICVDGKVNFHLIDGRQNSQTFNNELKITLTKNIGKVLKIPSGIWFSFSSKNKNSILSNFLEFPHKKNESIKKNLVKKYFIKK